MTPEELRAYGLQYAQSKGLDPALVDAIVMSGEQSGWRPNERASGKGAAGPMQLMPATARSLGVDRADPMANVRGGIDLLAQLSPKYNGDPRLIAAAYNAGEPAVTKYGGVPPYPETQAYVQRVTGAYSPNNQGSGMDATTQGNPDQAMAWLRKQGYVGGGNAAAANAPQSDQVNQPPGQAMSWLRQQGYVQPEQAPPQPPQDPQLARAAAAGFNRGALTGLPGLPVDTALNVWDMAKAIPGVAYHEITGKPVPDALTPADRSQYPMSSEWIARKMRENGGAPVIDNPSPDNALARNLYAGGDFAAQALLTKGAMDRAPASMTGAPMVPARIPSTAQANVANVKAAAQAGASGFAGNAIAEATGNPQLGLLATFGPNVIDMAPTAARIAGGTVTENQRQALAQRLQDFKGAGVDAGVGLGKDGWLTQWMQTAAANSPGGSYVMDQAGKRTQAQMGQRVGDIVNTIADDVGPRAAGNAVTQATKDYRDRQQQIYGLLDEKASSMLDPSAPVPVTNFAQRFADKFSPIPGAPAASQALAGSLSGARNLGQALLQDATPAPVTVSIGGQRMTLVQTPQGSKLAPAAAQTPGAGTVPYDALAAVKGRMGDLAFPSNPLLADANQGALKYLYGGLAADQRAAAASAGPMAAAARQRASDFYAGTQAKLENILGPLAKGGDVAPGDVFDRLNTMTRDKGSELAQVWSSLPASARQSVTATVVDNLGRTGPGAQNADGSLFSSRAFLTNWNKLSPEGKNVLFSGFPAAKNVRANLDTVAQAADAIDQATKAYTNPSKTGKASTATALGGSMLAGLMGHPVAGAFGVGAVGMSALTAKMMTSPRFAQWLATAAALPANRLAGQMTTLGQWARVEKDPELRRDLTNFVRSVQTTQPDLGQGVAPAYAR